LTAQEEGAHRAFVAAMKAPVWAKYPPQMEDSGEQPPSAA
jgi:hypothetical protein